MNNPLYDLISYSASTNHTEQESLLHLMRSLSIAKGLGPTRGIVIHAAKIHHSKFVNSLVFVSPVNPFVYDSPS
jgi:hypothetical protein